MIHWLRRGCGCGCLLAVVAVVAVVVTALHGMSRSVALPSESASVRPLPPVPPGIHARWATPWPKSR